MAKGHTLSTGSMEAIMTGNEYSKPILQILGTKKISGAEGSERYRLLLSDGQYLNSFAMLASQLNYMYAAGDLSDYTIVRVDQYTTSMVNKSEKGDKRVVIILGLTVVNRGSQVGEKIGNPVPYVGESALSAASGASSKPANKPTSAVNNNRISENNNSRPNKPISENYKIMPLNDSMKNSTTHPISSLSPYQNKWVIKARVQSKSSIRTWSNAKGEGKLFSMDLIDESGEIRATVFKEACDKFYDMIQVDNVYFISKCVLKTANKQFSNLNHEYEMTFTNDTIVEQCAVDDTEVPQIKYNFVPISQISSIEPKAVVDVIGVCRDVSELQIFTSKTSNRELKKKEVTLVDSSNASIQLTLWGDEAVNFDGYVQPVILVKGARVSEFGGGKNLSLGSGTCIKINPDIPEGHKLRGWFDNGGGENISNSISARTGAVGSFNAEWFTFKDMQVKRLGLDDKPFYFQTKAVIHIIRNSNTVYKACPGQDCNKKLVDESNGQYRCEKCNTSYNNFKYRMLLSLSIGDWTSSRWVTCFSDLAEKIIGKSAEEVGDEIEKDNEASDKIFPPVYFKCFIFKLRSKMENYGDQTRSKITIVSADPINYAEYNKYLIQNLQQLTGIGRN